MNILFITYTNTNSAGGHTHSMLHIANEVAKGHNAKIISLGDGRSRIYEESPLYLSYCDISKKKIFSLNKRMRNVLNNFEPDIVHFFDEYSYLLCASLNVFKKSKLVYTKCGGKSSHRKFWVYMDHIITFSQENYNWYKQSEEYNNSNIYLIPNRVSPIQLTESRDNSKERFNFMRIARIGEGYKKSFLSLIDLVQKLQTDGLNVSLYLVGIVQDPIVYEEIKEYAKNAKINHEFITDERCKVASKLLYLADCVLGTGRGLMEAMSVKLPVLTTAQNCDLPVLIDEKCFYQCFVTNFSPRNKVSEDIISHNYENIFKLVSDKLYYSRISEISLQLFEEHLSSQNICALYNQVYNKALISKERRMPFINKIYYLKYLFEAAR